MVNLTSLQNGKVKLVVRLRNRRERDETGLYLIEGYRELSRASKAKVHIESLFICPSLFLGTNEEELIQSIKSTKAPVYLCTPTIFKKISYRDRPDGLLAIAKKSPSNLQKISLSKSPFVVVAQAIEKPGNLGTILRSSDAAKVDGLVVCDRCTDVFNPNVVRASVGTLFTVPLAECSSQETISWLRHHSIQIVAATPQASTDYTEVDFTGPVAIAVGAEQFGLSPFWMENADLKVSIPMLGVADSLNVATATTLLLYEVVRQRRASDANFIPG